MIEVLGVAAICFCVAFTVSFFIAKAYREDEG